jgi:hypothetical protein
MDADLPIERKHGGNKPEKCKWYDVEFHRAFEFQDYFSLAMRMTASNAGLG